MLAAFPGSVVKFASILSILVVDEETSLVKSETQLTEFIMLSFTLNHLPDVPVAIPYI